MCEKNESYKNGLLIRKQMFGADHVKTVVENASSFTREFEEFTTRYCFDEIWGSDGLDLRTRSLVTIAILTAINKSEKLKSHVRAAIENGVSIDELREVLLHTTVYAGVPAGVDGHKVSEEVLVEMGLIKNK